LNRRSAGRSASAKPPPRRSRAKVRSQTKPKGAVGPGSKSAHSKSAHSKSRKAASGKRAQSPRTIGSATDPALRRARAAIRNLQAELAEARARIDELQAWADTDFLLDILNRRGFERELARALAYIRRYSGSGALVVLDIDGLKPINDACGHAAGDAVLKGVVAVLRRQVRSSDVIGRLGGDEFGVLLWNLDEARARIKAAALERAIDRLTFAFRGRPFVAGASAGVAMLDATRDPAAILDAADRAMYVRKRLRKDAAAGSVRR
jgi:diguanylate cyclase (GGDEF)-like protein